MRQCLVLLMTGLLLGCNEVVPMRALAPLAEHNLILIVVDTLRPDHLGCYGYERETTPNIDRLAKDGVIFDAARSASSYTGESVTALLTGELPSCAGGTGWGARPSGDVAILGERFRDAGFETALMASTLMLKPEAFTRGFDTVLNLGKSWQDSTLAPKLTDHAIDFMSQHRDERFALYLHYLDPHAPYRPPLRLRERTTDAPPELRLRLYGQVREELTALREDGFGPGDPRYEDLIGRYDAEIMLIDESIGRLIASLTDFGLDRKTLVVLTADHGEEFLEHEFVEHAWTLYDESLRVPLLFWAPGMLRRGRVEEAVSLIDVMPTLWSVLVDANEVSESPGASLLASDGAELVASVRPRPVISELLVKRRSVLRSFVDGGWKYIASQHWLEPDQRAAAIALDAAAENGVPEIWGPVIHEELYDLRTDPAERHNRIDSAPEKRAHFARLYVQHRDRCSAHSDGQSDVLDEAQIEALRALGYVD